MGLFNILFPEDNSLVEDVVTGAAIGAVIGDKLDERQDRARILQLLYALLAQGDYHFEIGQFDKRMKVLDKWHKDEKAASDAWPWPWDMGNMGSLKLYAEQLRPKNKEFHNIHTKLASEWRDLRDRARLLDFSAAVHMPRSVYGDIMGTPEMLRHGLDQVREKVELLEAEKAINAKFGAK